jgi:hypothetical protein
MAALTAVDTRSSPNATSAAIPKRRSQRRGFFRERGLRGAASVGSRCPEALLGRMRTAAGHQAGLAKVAALMTS